MQTGHSLPSAVITVLIGLGGLDPILFTATTCTEYTVNGVRPVTVSSVVADVKTDVFPLPSPTTCSVIWYTRMGALLSAGSSHDKKMDVVLACKVVTTGASGGPNFFSEKKKVQDKCEECTVREYTVYIYTHVW